ncbi:hypothetical protein [Streptomyces sp. NPDC088789]|uniref:hypothetical protein n=1 Tax=Streptomyces sp. NPDC088789 TaxID=3365899 RepID=UPI00382CF494
MLTSLANGDSRTSFWPRVREFAVPPSMIETATARRLVGDWAGACAAARVEVDLDLRAAARVHGRELASRLRTDLRHLAPDLLRWHLPRVAPDGLLRTGLTIALARYDAPARDGTSPVWLVARTVPAWADAGQRFALGLWNGDLRTAHGHPHPRPNPRFRLDLHRHLWDARRTAELRFRSGAGSPPDHDRYTDLLGPLDLADLAADGRRCAVGRWPAEAQRVLRDAGRTEGAVLVRVDSRRRFVLEAGGTVLRRAEGARTATALPVLPDAATWVPPDVELLRAGAIDAGRLHPLVAEALVPGREPAPTARRAAGPREVECRGETHRIGLVDGVLVPLDHPPDEIRRETLLATLTGTPLGCLQAVDQAHRRPDLLPDIEERLRHGDTTGALAIVESLLGPDASLRDGALRDALETAARRRILYGLFRAGLSQPGARRTPPLSRPRRGVTPPRSPHPRHAQHG